MATVSMPACLRRRYRARHGPGRPAASPQRGHALRGRTRYRATPPLMGELIPTLEQFVERGLDIARDLRRRLLQADARLDPFLEGTGDLRRPVPVQVDRH